MKINSFCDRSILPVLLLFPLVNLGFNFWKHCTGSVATNIDTFLFLKEVAVLIFVAIAEELFFRGLLFRELVFGFKYKPVLSAIIVSILFGALHLLNVFSYATTFYAIVQSLCAFAISFNLSAIYYRCRTIIPCIVIHSAINITSIGLDSGVEKLSLSSLEASVFLMVAVLYLIYGYMLFNRKQFLIDEGEDE